MPLAKVFSKVFGIDVSESQLESARNKISGQEEYNNIEYFYANSHDLDEFWSNTMNKSYIDLVTFGQCLHWLDHDLLFKSYQKYMAEGGAMAIFSYGTCKIVDANVLEEVQQAIEQGVVKGADEVLEIKFENIESHGVEMDKEYSEEDTKANELLYVRDLYNLRLNAEMIVLSACETGIGKYEEGEGVYSLARSFMYAGVPSLLTSLWKVDDASTGTLIPYFYQKLSDQQDIDQAIREAKMDYLAQAKLEVKHPFYWAGFIALGDAHAVIKSSPNYLLIGGIVAALAVLVFIGFYLFKARK